MTEDTRKFVEEKTKEILNAGSCCPELKEMAGSRRNYRRKGRDRSISSGII